MTKKLNTPYAGLLPPLSTEEFEALKSDVKDNGVQSPILVDEDDNILDGHHRYRIDKDAPIKIVRGLSEQEKQALVIKCNLIRRNLSPSQKSEVLKKQKAIAKQLRELDAKKWTQAKVAKTLGVSRESISKWFTTNGKDTNSCKPDARVKVNTSAKEKIITRVDAGETQSQVAADFGITQQAVGKIVKQAGEVHSRDNDKARKTAHLKNLKFEVRKGDFRKVLKDIEGVSLCLTDPPYPKESIDLWTDLGKWASHALAENGILIAYSGQMYLPQVLSNLSKHLDYWWCGAVVHSGTGNLTPLGHPVRKVINGWKPLVMFVRKGGGYEKTFRDCLVGAGSQKTDHNWQQHEAEAGALIEAFTKEGELVVDPFAGSGGFCKAASDLGRIAIGAEILA